MGVQHFFSIEVLLKCGQVAAGKAASPQLGTVSETPL